MERTHLSFDPSALRRTLRARRAAIPARRRQRAGVLAWHLLQHWPPLHFQQRVACYLATDDEFPTAPIIEGLWRLGKAVYLPLLDPRRPGHLRFQRYHPHSPMHRNRFGILEPLPQRREQVAPAALQLVLVPLVGFDGRGHRLGMGGGFYDRSFAFLQRAGRRGRPFLLGLAFARQEVAELPARPWDVPLDGVLTERGLRRFR